MKIVLSQRHCPLLLLLLPGSAHGWMEFGRSSLFNDKPLWKRKRVLGLERVREHMGTMLLGHHSTKATNTDAINRILDEFEEVLDVSNDLIDVSLSLSMSMSMGSSTGDSSPSPTMAPSVSPDRSPSLIPSDLPSLAPSIPVTGVPTSVNLVTAVPVSTVAPTPVATTSAPTPPAFDCTENNNSLSLATATEAGSIAIALTVGYKAESTNNSTTVFTSELERQLLETAVLAALGSCGADSDTDDGRLLRGAPVRRLSVVSTADIGPCEATRNATQSCTIMETEMLFFLKGPDVDTDIAAHISYTAIEEHMLRDKYIGIVPTVLLVEYLSPFPLPPPPPNGSNSNNASTDVPVGVDSTTASDRLSVSPWTIGACVATIMGGVISLLVWKRNRQSRQRRAVQMTEHEEDDDHYRHHQNHDAHVMSGARNPIEI